MVISTILATKTPCPDEGSGRIATHRNSHILGLGWALSCADRKYRRCAPAGSWANKISERGDGPTPSGFRREIFRAARGRSRVSMAHRRKTPRIPTANQGRVASPANTGGALSVNPPTRTWEAPCSHQGERAKARRCLALSRGFLCGQRRYRHWAAAEMGRRCRPSRRKGWGFETPAGHSRTPRPMRPK